MIARIASRFTAGAKRLCAASPLRQLAKREDGVAAVEFAIVAAPFLAMVFAIIETAIVFFAGQALETAVADSARLIMTGQAQSQGFTAAQFKTAVCARIFGLFDCNNGVMIDVRTAAAFASVNVAKPVDANGNLVNNFVFQPGGPGCIVVVRAMYQWPVYVSLLGLNISDMSGSKRMIMGTAAFRNEPFGTPAPC